MAGQERGHNLALVLGAELDQIRNSRIQIGSLHFGLLVIFSMLHTHDRTTLLHLALAVSYKNLLHAD